MSGPNYTVGSEDTASILEESAVSLNDLNAVQAQSNVNAENGKIRANDHFGGDDNYNLQCRPPLERPVYKLSVRLIETYKYINKVYYEAKAQKLKGQKDSSRSGVHNDGFDDQHYDYILQGDEILQERYILKHRMGKGSFGQVVCAYDRERKCEVAIKIIKSRKPFLLQARTEIEILSKILEKDEEDDSNIVRLLDNFVYRNHQCIVFEILSFNLYELLKNTKFKGVSLNLIRKFSRSLVKALEFLSRPDVNIIHCDLKPENILLKHPRRSMIKLIDFGSSCYLNKKTYSYIQSRFYRSPEVILGLSYTQKIDMWSFGCVVVEMHTGEPLFGGANQADQMCRIIDILGMPPLEMIRKSPEKVRSLFFERIEVGASLATNTICDMKCVVYEEDNSAFYALKRPVKDMPRPRSLREILGVHTGGPNGLRVNEPDHSPSKYEEFLDFVERLLVYSPEQRASAAEIAHHPYLHSDLQSNMSTPQKAVIQGMHSQLQEASCANSYSSGGNIQSAQVSIQPDEQPNEPYLPPKEVYSDPKRDLSFLTRGMPSARANKVRSKSAPGGL